MSLGKWQKLTLTSILTVEALFKLPCLWVGEKEEKGLIGGSLVQLYSWLLTPPSLWNYGAAFSLAFTIATRGPQGFVLIALRAIGFLISLGTSSGLLWMGKLVAYASLSSFLRTKNALVFETSSKQIGILNFYLSLAVILFHKKHK